MEPLDSLEIYIPVEAVVQSVLLRSLPNSVLRRMGLRLSDMESPEGIWISPVVLRSKGQKHTSPAGNHSRGNVSSVLSRMSQDAPDPYPVPFVSSCNRAYKVLEEAMRPKKLLLPSSHISKSPPASAAQTDQDAVIIYHGRVYLSIRWPRQSQHQQRTCEPQPASQSAVSSASDTSSVTQKRLSSLEPADTETQRKRRHVTLPQIASEQPKDVLTKADQEHLHDNKPRNQHSTWKATHSENKKDVIHKGRDVTSSMTAHAVPQSADAVNDVHCHRHDDAKGKQATEQVSGLEEAWIQPQDELQDGTSNEVEELGGDEADPNCDPDSNVKAASGQSDDILGVVEPGNSQSWTSRGSRGAASTSLLQRTDYTELAQEEEIARLKAKLRRSDAALSSLQSPEQQ